MFNVLIFDRDARLFCHAKCNSLGALIQREAGIAAHSEISCAAARANA